VLELEMEELISYNFENKMQVLLFDSPGDKKNGS
jgi:hypothetical protein